jgi:hypothetical protein
MSQVVRRTGKRAHRHEAPVAARSRIALVVVILKLRNLGQKECTGVRVLWTDGISRWCNESTTHWRMAVVVKWLYFWGKRK